ncbi:MAG: hypothetical protein ACRDZX_08775 [Acidimicrobiales bacterium]
MTDGVARGKTPGLNQLRFDRRLLTSAEILAGAGVVLWTAGWVVGVTALRRAAQDWLEQLDQAPSELAISKLQQFLHATTAGTSAYRSAARPGT